MISKSTLDKFPNSRLTTLARTQIGESRDNPIIIDRDAKHSEIVIDLMRQPDTVYAEHLRQADLLELLDELKYYSLDLIVNIVKQLVRFKPKPSIIRIIFFDHKQLIENITRPLVVIGLDSICPVKLKDTAKIMKALNSSDYDVRVFKEPFDDSPFKIIGFRPLHICLYVPGSIVPKLVLDKSCDAEFYYHRLVHEFLLALNVHFGLSKNKDRLKYLETISVRE